MGFRSSRPKPLYQGSKGQGCSVKATFHYSSKLQIWLQTWFSTAGLQPGFRQVRVGLRHAFDFFVENLVANRRHVKIDAACSLVRARARQMECRKNPFRASQRTC